MGLLLRIAGVFINQDAKELEGVRGGLFRWLWRFYTWRLTHAGRWLVWPTVGLFAYTSSSLSYQAYVVLAYVLALWLVALGAALFFTPRARITVEHADRVSAGQTLPVEIAIEPAGAWSSDLYVVPHRLPAAVEAVPPDGVPVPPALPGQKARARLALHCPRRGVYRLQGYRLESDFPFGIVRSLRAFERESALVVYPRYEPLLRVEIPTGRRYQPGGVALASEMGDSVEFIGNRDYREGDNVRDIDWRATARLSKPIVREYRQEYFLRVAIILDTHVPRAPFRLGPQTWRASRRQSFEHAVSATAAMGEFLARKEYIVDIFAAGPNLYHLTAGRSLAYLEQILDILACVEENPQEPFAVIEPELMSNLSRISTVICVFLDWNETRRAFVRNLRAENVGVKTIVISDTPCTLSPREEGDVRLLTHADFANGIEEL
ncbi:MAG: DUF58 domain-containing protein [Planctomycetota bacterium]|nr:DUF58 domain-containing protein [Planctomycetota bacterium]